MRSDIWSGFHEICDKKSDEPFPDFFFCLRCEEVLHCPIINGNINVLRRHSCTKDQEKKKSNKKDKKKVNVSVAEKEELKQAAAKFICKDLRPYHAIDCPGLFDLCASVMKFGQKHTSANEDALKAALPTRNTVKSAISGNNRAGLRRTQNFFKSSLF